MWLNECSLPSQSNVYRDISYETMLLHRLYQCSNEIVTLTWTRRPLNNAFQFLNGSLSCSCSVKYDNVSYLFSERRSWPIATSLAEQLHLSVFLIIVKRCLCRKLFHGLLLSINTNLKSKSFFSQNLPAVYLSAFCDHMVKYAGLSSQDEFVAIAVESINRVVLRFLSELGSWWLVETTGDVRASSFLFQRISVVVQRFNSVLLHDGYIDDDRPE